MNLTYEEACECERLALLKRPGQPESGGIYLFSNIEVEMIYNARGKIETVPILWDTLKNSGAS